MTKKRVLFVNHREKACGVNQLGARYFANMAETDKYEMHYIDVDSRNVYEDWATRLSPDAVIYNFYSGATMPWMSPQLIQDHRRYFKQLGIYHELPMESMGYDLLFHQDPNPPENQTFPHWPLPRSLPRCIEQPDLRVEDETEIPLFGSFGFGLGDKGFSRVVERVQADYDEARIHLHIPFAHFGDATGQSAQAHADQARSVLTKPGISLTIDHDFWEEEQLLHWLAGNTCNCFFYGEHYGRGIASTLDYALASGRPLAITKSYQFRHIWGTPHGEDFLMEEYSLPQIIKQSKVPLAYFQKFWSREAFVHSFEKALESIGV